MKFVIGGGTGFIGQALANRWLKAGHEIVIITRSKEKVREIYGKDVIAMEWTDLSAKLTTLFDNTSAIFNLSGANIGDARWTPHRQQEILSSRIETTKRLSELCATFGNNSPPLFVAGGVGIYGKQEPVASGLPLPLDEKTNIDFHQATNFLAKIGRDWELASMPAVNAGVRVVKMRFGVVLSNEGGVLAKLITPYKCFMGGPIGSGAQPFSWISLSDLFAAIEFLLKTQEAGPFNLVAPQCVQQKEFAKMLGEALHRPAVFSTPAWAIKLFFGQMGEELLLSGQYVVPWRLSQLGFVFQYLVLKAALRDIFTVDSQRKILG